MAVHRHIGRTRRSHPRPRPSVTGPLCGVTLLVKAPFALTSPIVRV
jgi:hypothetical protein